MATNQHRFSESSSLHSKPKIVPGKFASGATTPIKRGELLELTASGATLWVPMDSDFVMAANVAIAGAEIKSGDYAGYYPIIVPRVGDVFEYELLSSDSQNPAIGTPVYWSSSEIVTTTTGTGKLGAIVGFAHYPYPQGHSADDASYDKGTTLRTVTGRRVLISITAAASYYRALFPEAVS